MISHEEILEMVATEAVEKHNLYHSGDGNWRDRVITGRENVPCEVHCCPLNRHEHCVSPAAIKIKANGKCAMGEESIEAAYKLAKEKALQLINDA